MTETHLLRKKSDAFAALKAYAAKMKAQGHRMEWFGSDNGGEFASTKAKDFMQSKGIEWQLTSPYSPHQNGVVERCYTTPSKLWGEAILTVTYLKNRSPTKALASHGTLYEAWYHHKPDLSHLRPFSYVAYHCNEDPHQKKIGEKSWRSVKFQLLGHEGTNQ